MIPASNRSDFFEANVPIGLAKLPEVRGTFLGFDPAKIGMQFVNMSELFGTYHQKLEILRPTHWI
jgi:hypothetical protein